MKVQYLPSRPVFEGPWMLFDCLCNPTTCIHFKFMLSPPNTWHKSLLLSSGPSLQPLLSRSVQRLGNVGNLIYLLQFFIHFNKLYKYMLMYFWPLIRCCHFGTINSHFKAANYISQIPLLKWSWWLEERNPWEIYKVKQKPQFSGCLGPSRGPASRALLAWHCVALPKRQGFLPPSRTFCF